MNFDLLPKQIQEWLYSNELTAQIISIGEKNEIDDWGQIQIAGLIASLSLKEIDPAAAIAYLVKELDVDLGMAEKIAGELVKVFKPKEYDFKKLGIDINLISVIAKETREKILRDVLEKQAALESAKEGAASIAGQVVAAETKAAAPVAPVTSAQEKPFVESEEALKQKKVEEKQEIGLTHTMQQPVSKPEEVGPEKAKAATATEAGKEIKPEEPKPPEQKPEEPFIVYKARR